VLIIVGYLSRDDIHGVGDEDDEWFSAVDGRKIHIRVYNTQWKGNKNYTHGPYYIGCACMGGGIYEAVHFQHLYIKCECVCTVGVCITRPIRSLYERTSHYVFSALRRVKNKFAKLFLFFFIISVLYYIYELFSAVPALPVHPAPFLISLTLFMSFLKLINKS